MTNQSTASQLMDIALRIREMREILGYSIQEMAERTETNEETYRTYEAGTIDLPFTFMHKCAKVFGLELTDLLEGRSARLSGYTVTRKGKGLTTASEDGITIQDMAPMFRSKLAAPYYVTYEYSEELQDEPIHTVTHDGQEHAVLPVDGDHTVGGGGFVEDAVAFPEDFLVVADLNLHGALDDQVEFLTVMGGGVDGQVLQLGGVLVGDPVGGSKLLTEHGSHVLDGDAILAGGHQTLTPAGNGVAGKLCALAFQKVGDFQTEDLGTLVHKGEGKVHCTGLVQPVGFLGNLRQVCHLLLTVAQDLPHFTNTLGDLHQLIHSRLIGHICYPLFPRIMNIIYRVFPPKAPPGGGAVSVS